MLVTVEGGGMVSIAEVRGDTGEGIY